MKRQNKRIWLNADPSMLACAAYDVDSSESKFGFDNDLTIRDCSRQITLEFHWGAFPSQTKSKAIKKLNKLIDFLEEFKEHLLDLPEKPKET